LHLHMYSSNRTPSDVTRLPQTSHDWDSIELFVGLTTFVAFVRQMCTQSYVTSQDFNSINYLWDWPFLLAFVSLLGNETFRYSLRWLGSLRFTIGHNLVKTQSWENLILQNHSNNYELSKNAIKMTFSLISGQKIIMKRCAR
jgi:hypothetical protein